MAWPFLSEIIGQTYQNGRRQEEEAADNLKAVVPKMDTAKIGEPAFLAILTAGQYPVRRKAGIFVVPIGCLGP